jgi:hypothetical protein
VVHKAEATRGIRRTTHLRVTACVGSARNVGRVRRLGAGRNQGQGDGDLWA